RDSSKVSDVVNYPIQPLQRLGFASFPKGDSHWSDAGCLAVARSILAPFADLLGLRLPVQDDFDASLEPMMGDLAVHTERRETEQIMRLRPRQESYRITLNNRKPNRGNITIT